MSEDPRLKPLIDKTLPPRLERMSAAEIEAEGQERPRRAPINLGMCSGVGKVGITIDGDLCCPDCRSPLADGCGVNPKPRQETVAVRGDVL